jgi:hypothetical protein
LANGNAASAEDDLHPLQLAASWSQAAGAQPQTQRLRRAKRAGFFADWQVGVNHLLAAAGEVSPARVYDLDDTAAAVAPIHLKRLVHMFPSDALAKVIHDQSLHAARLP